MIAVAIELAGWYEMGRISRIDIMTVRYHRKSWSGPGF